MDRYFQKIALVIILALSGICVFRPAAIVSNLPPLPFESVFSSNNEGDGFLDEPHIDEGVSATNLAVPEAFEASFGRIQIEQSLLHETRDGNILFAIGKSPSSEAVFIEAHEQDTGQWMPVYFSFPGEYILMSGAQKSIAANLPYSVRDIPFDVIGKNDLARLIRFEPRDLEEMALIQMAVSAPGYRESIEPNTVVFPVGIPNDPEYTGSWALAKLDLEPIWEEFGFGPFAGPRPVIAVIDNGAPANGDYDLWINEEEIPENGIDDDGNGFVDDVSGFNFYRRSPDLSYAGGHGSSIARIAASTTNNAKGTASPASAPLLMRVLYAEHALGGHFSAVDAMFYAIRNGADVINCSFVANTGTYFDRAVSLAEKQDVIVVAAAGNGGNRLGDVILYPAYLDFPNLLTVGASDEDDSLGNSNYSSTHVDLFAPGTSTSMATPLVTSVAALLRGIHPKASAAEIRQAILDGVDPVPALEQLCVSGGRLNAKNALESLFTIAGRPAGDLSQGETPTLPAFEISQTTENSVTVHWTPEQSSYGYELEVRQVGQPFSTKWRFTEGESSIEVTELMAGVSYQFRMRAFLDDLSSPWSESDPFALSTPVFSFPPPIHFWVLNDLEDNRIIDHGQVPMPIALSPERNQKEDDYDFFADGMGLAIPDSDTLNLGLIKEMTLSIWIKPSQAQREMTSVLYEQGGFWRGFNLLLVNGWLQANGWNRLVNESDWKGTQLLGPKLSMDTEYLITISLEADSSIREEAFHLYLDGKVVAVGPASQLWPQYDQIGLGQVKGGTVFKGREVRRLDPYMGQLDTLLIWDRALSPEQVQALYDEFELPRSTSQ